MFLPGLSISPASLDHGMRAGLADSLAYLHSSGLRPHDRSGDDVAVSLAEIRAHRVRPGLFGRYYDLVFAARARRGDLASALFHEIVDLATEQPALNILPFSEDALGSDMVRYRHLIASVASKPGLPGTPQPDQWRNFTADLTAARALIAAADPDLATEIDALVVEIVGAFMPAQDQVSSFGGASSFTLWGAVFLNMAHYQTPLDLFEGLVHEAAHQLLFGLAQNEPCVTNAIEERYASPLRTDPRPMDGLFHQSFVCACLHYAYRRLAAAGLLSAGDLALTEERIDRYHRFFYSGYEVVARHGRITPTGAGILQAAVSYMESIDP
jgi:hypothetical protein